MSWFTNLFDARRKVANWKLEYNEQRPHSSLGYRTPAEFARVVITQSYAKDVSSAHLENACAFPLSHSSGGGLDLQNYLCGVRGQVIYTHSLDPTLPITSIVRRLDCALKRPGCCGEGASRLGAIYRHN